jgi:SAM-dependent methyltransferase
MREAEVRPADLHERYLQLSREDIERYFADRSRWRECACPACGEDQPVPAIEKDGFKYVECSACHSLYASPRPPKDALDTYYAESPSNTFWAQEFFPRTQAARREKIIRPRVNDILEHERGRELTSGTPTVIDAGAGTGAFLEELVAAAPGVQAIAVEPGGDLADAVRKAGFDCVEKPVEECDELAGRADLVTSFELLEHVHDPLEFVASLGRLAKPGGLVLVTGLGCDGFDIQVLWERSKSITPPHHLNFLSVHGLERLFERAGLRDVAVETPGKLDVEMVGKALDDLGDGAELRFVRLLVERRGEEVAAAFQQFLKDARLSSHTWIWARA